MSGRTETQVTITYWRVDWMYDDDVDWNQGAKYSSAEVAREVCERSASVRYKPSPVKAWRVVKVEINETTIEGPELELLGDCLHQSTDATGNGCADLSRRMSNAMRGQKADEDSGESAKQID